MLGKQELATLLSTDRTKQMAIIQNDVNTEAQNFGIEIVDVRIKRADLPPANSEAIYKRMQTERETVTTESGRQRIQEGKGNLIHISHLVNLN